MSAVTATPNVPGMRRNIGRLLVEVFRSRPWPVVALVMIAVVGNARAGVYIASMGGITQALIDRDQREAIVWTLIFLGASVVEQLYWPLHQHFQSMVMDSATHRLQGRVLLRASSAPLVAFEDGPFFARLQRASDNIGQRIANIFRALYVSLQTLLGIISILVPLWLINPVFVPVLIAGFIPGFVTQYRTARVVHEARLRHATGDRLLQRLGAILTDRESAAELRLFGNGPDLVRRWSETRRKRGDDVLAAELVKARAVTWGEVGVSAGIATSLIIIVWMLIEQRTPVGSWVTVLVGIEVMVAMVYGLAATSRGVREDGAFLSDLFAFEDETDRMVAAHQREAKPTTVPVHRSAVPRAGSLVRGDQASRGAMRIVVDQISFSYPDAGHPVVRNVSLTLEPGERVAIVGENGAGKSTLVRLLTGLYVPDAGVVTQDGIDTRSEGARQLRSRIGAVFQDYVPWQMTARENIGLSDLARMDDDCALELAAEQAGILGVVDGLPDGLDTWLGREFGERDLSGGQWQRIALARAFFRNSRFLVMDEPTAALDPLAEQRLFERFSALAEGRTALTISHRLGPARFADRAIVMDAGRIVEAGHHDDLMERNGLYARMFLAQSEWYRDDGPGLAR